MYLGRSRRKVSQDVSNVLCDLRMVGSRRRRSGNESSSRQGSQGQRVRAWGRESEDIVSTCEATGAKTWYAKVDEGGTFSILARVTALQGTGVQVLPEEGSCLKQVDLASIVCKVFDLGSNPDATAGILITPSPTVSAAANVFDSLQINGWLTREDSSGYNFRHDVSATYVQLPDEWYLIEYKFTLTGGSIVWLKVKVKTVRTL